MLLPRIEEYCRATGTAESTFGRLAVNDGKLVRRLRAGGSITLKTLQRIESLLSRTCQPARPIDRMVGLRIRMRREQMGLSQPRLAARLAISPALMQELEGGTVRAEATRLCAIARALDAPISYFFADWSSREDAGPESDAWKGVPAAPGAAELLSAYARIGSYQLQRVVLAVALRLARDAPKSEYRLFGGSQVRPRSSRAH